MTTGSHKDEVLTVPSDPTIEGLMKSIIQNYELIILVPFK